MYSRHQGDLRKWFKQSTPQYQLWLENLWLSAKHTEATSVWLLELYSSDLPVK